MAKPIYVPDGLKEIDESDEIEAKDFKEFDPATDEHLDRFTPNEQDYADHKAKYGDEKPDLLDKSNAKTYLPKGQWKPSDPLVLKPGYDPLEENKCKTWEEWLEKYEPGMFTQEQIKMFNQVIVAPDNIKEEWRVAVAKQQAK